MGRINLRNVKIRCHERFMDIYLLFTLFMVKLRLFYFIEFQFTFLQQYLSEIIILLVLLILLPFIYLIINSKYIINIYRIVSVTGGSFTPILFLLKINLRIKLAMFLFFISISSINFYLFYHKEFNKMRFMILATMKRYLSMIHVIFISFFVTFMLFCFYLYFLLFIIISEDQTESLLFFRNDRYFFIFDLIHLYWTSYILLYTANFFIVSYLNYTIVSQIDNVDFSYLRSSLSFADKSLGNIVYSAILPKIEIRNMNLFQEYIINFSMYIPMFFNMVMFPYYANDNWIIPFIALMNKCACSRIRNNLLGHRVNDKVRGIRFYTYLMRYFLTSLIFAIFMQRYSSDQVISNYFVTLEDFKPILFILCVTVFANALISHFIENIWKSMILYTFFDKKGMKEYDQCLFNRIEMDILDNLGE